MNQFLIIDVEGPVRDPMRSAYPDAPQIEDAVRARSLNVRAASAALLEGAARRQLAWANRLRNKARAWTPSTAS